MCPACLATIATVAQIAVGATSIGGLAAVVVMKGRAKTGANSINAVDKSAEGNMNHPRVVSHAEWLVARKALLAKEKESTRQRDALSAERRSLPMVKIEKEYVFEGPNGRTSLRDLFDAGAN